MPVADTYKTVTVEICIKYEGNTKEYAKYLALQELKMCLKNLLSVVTGSRYYSSQLQPG
jgi:hypothetical protein